MKKRTAFYLTVIGTLLVVAAAAAAYMFVVRQGRPAVVRFSIASTQSVSAFFPNEQGILERKTVEVTQQLPDQAKGEAIFRTLKELRCIPDRLKLYDLAVGKDGVLYLNVSKEFLDSTTPEKEITVTYGIVDSFIESFPGAKSVQLIVEGQPVYTRSGVLYILEPLEFNRDVLEE